MVSSRFYLACIKNTGKRESALVLVRTMLVRTTGETRVRAQIFVFAYDVFLHA